MGHDSREGVGQVPKLLWGTEPREGREREEKPERSRGSCREGLCHISYPAGDMQSLSPAPMPLVGSFGFYLLLF